MVLSGQAVPPPFVRLAAHAVRWRLLSELARSDLRVRELVALVGEPQNLVSYHLRLLRSVGLVNARRSSFDGRDSYYHLDLERCADALAAAGAALHPALRLLPTDPGLATDAIETGTLAAGASAAPSVLFMCTGNSARSPIAEALLRRRVGSCAEVTSAGSHPKAHLHPNAVRVLRQRYGIDITDRHPRHLDTMTGRRFDYVISLCDKVREVCPDFGDHPQRLHWSIPDPAATSGDDTDRDSYPAFDRTAAEIDTRIRYLQPMLFPTPHRKVQP